MSSSGSPLQPGARARGCHSADRMVSVFKGTGPQNPAAMEDPAALWYQLPHLPTHLSLTQSPWERVQGQSHWPDNGGVHSWSHLLPLTLLSHSEHPRRAHPPLPQTAEQRRERESPAHCPPAVPWLGKARDLPDFVGKETHCSPRSLTHPSLLCVRCLGQAPLAPPSPSQAPVGAKSLGDVVISDPVFPWSHPE